MSQCKHLELNRKSTKTYELQFLRDGSGVDITGWTVYFTVKKNMEDTDLNAKITKVVTSHDSAATGKTLIELTSLDTDITAENYYYSIDYLDDEGNEDILFWGKIRISEPVLKTRS